ncbi:DivIVA domain-containing protein [Arthrobacter sp. SLBN-83]|uniref:DivIVA domain-containing protein n=1 Tax=Arthrobacter sp. SLBN-83 TaxID=2768449 RepID=UPI0011512B2F|nr:DivIVA domain-containing protein [Arthrobacter sp. SLBN-83]
MSFFLVFLAVVLVAAVLWAGLGRRSRKTGNTGLPALLDGGFEEPPANLPPVLLPEHAVPEDVTRLRFSLGLRGYRMDQVDQVLDELRDQLAAKDAEIAGLRGRLEAPEDAAEQESDAGSASGDKAGEEPGTGSAGEAGFHGGSGQVHEDATPGKGGL